MHICISFLILLVCLSIIYLSIHPSFICHLSVCLASLIYLSTCGSQDPSGLQL